MGWVGKGCLGLVGLVGLAAGLLTGGYWWSKQRRARQAELDEARYSVLCDTIRTVTEPPFLAFDGFAPAELRPLTFYLVRGGQVRQDTTVRARRYEDPPEAGLQLPFARFRTADTIVVVTAGPNSGFITCLVFTTTPTCTTACWATWAATIAA